MDSLIINNNVIIFLYFVTLGWIVCGDFLASGIEQERAQEWRLQS